VDDKTGQREVKKRGLRPIWMLTVLDDAAEQGLVADLSEKLDLLERNTRFYISQECKRIIEGMKERDRERRSAEPETRP
jgi:predicted nucleic acid-binding protein